MAFEWRQRLQQAAQRSAGFGLGLWERARRGVGFDPFSAGFRRDPYPVYRAMYAHGRVYVPALANSAFVTHYDDIVELLRDDRFSADDRRSANFERFRERGVRRGLVEPDEPYRPSLLRMDDPDHGRLRSLVNKAFTPRAVAKLSDRVVGVVERQIDGLRGRGRADLLAELASPVPIVVIAEMLGVPADDLDRFKRWSDDIVLQLGANTLEDARRARRAGRELGEYLGAIADQRRVEPRDDLLSALLLAEEEGEKLTREEVLSTCELLLVAGNETTANLIGNGVHALLRHPGELEKLRAEPALVDRAVEEMLRWDSPVQATSRYTREDVEIAGVRVPKGMEVLLMLAAANRDPAHFENPDRFDVSREGEPHLSFSLGSHFCLGASLARMETRATIGALVEAFPALSLAEIDPPRRRNLILRGFERLPVALQ